MEGARGPGSMRRSYPTVLRLRESKQAREFVISSGLEAVAFAYRGLFQDHHFARNCANNDTRINMSVAMQITHATFVGWSTHLL
jgi:hypothetical protein